MSPCEKINLLESRDIENFGISGYISRGISWLNLVLMSYKRNILSTE